jgi:hypothetical protein
MKARQSDPPRIDDEPSELGDLVSAARSRRPTEPTVALIAERLTAAGVFAVPSARAPSAPPSTPAVFGRATVYKLGALVLVAIGGALVTWQRTSTPPTPAPVPAVEARLAEAPSEPARLAAPTAPSSVDMPCLPVEALPSSTAASVPAPERTERVPPPHAPEVRAATPARAVEFALIQRAQDALPSDPSRALAIADEHARTFPNGQLVQEREVMAVEALARLGRKAEARERANAALARFPRTPYVPRLQRALGEPLSPAARSKTAP